MRCTSVTIIAFIVACAMPPSGLGQEPKSTPGSLAQSKPQPAAGTDKASVKIKVVDATPEDAFRTLVLAIMARDEIALRAVALPNPELAWLLKGQVAPPEAVKNASAFFAKLPIQRLKAGDKYTLAKKQYAVDASEVGEEKVVLLPEGSPLPTRCTKVDGHWKVDTGPIIAGRKAADAARKRAEAKKAAAKKPTAKD